MFPVQYELFDRAIVVVPVVSGLHAFVAWRLGEAHLRRLQRIVSAVEWRLNNRML